MSQGCICRLKAIKATGATGCILTPVYASAPGSGQLGRAPISFFAPDNSYAVGQEPGAAAQELKQVICGFHKAGIEVILQVGTLSPPFISPHNMDVTHTAWRHSLLGCARAHRSCLEGTPSETMQTP